MEYNIAIIGEQASGKTNCVRLLKGLHIEERYFRTFSPDIHPMSILTNVVITIWDMPPENYEKYMDKMHGVIYVTKKKTPSIPDLNIPLVILSNRNNQMTHETAVNAYINIVNFVTGGEYSEYIRRYPSFVAS
jgi:hypothetical protein